MFQEAAQGVPPWLHGYIKGFLANMDVGTLASPDPVKRTFQATLDGTAAPAAQLNLETVTGTPQ